MLRSIRNILLVFLFILTFYLLKVLSSLLLPLIFATLVVIIYQPLMLFLRKYKFPTGVIVPIIATLTILIIFVIINIFINTIGNFTSQSDFLIKQFIKKVEAIISQIDELTNSRFNMNNISDYLLGLINEQSLTKALSSVFSGVGNFGKSFFMFSLYFVILLTSMTNYKEYISYVVKEDQRFLNEIESLQRSVSTYMTIKVIVSATTGLIAGIVCMAFGVKFPVFFGFLTFLFNFIPSIGSIIATIPPVLMAIIQFDTYQRVIFILIILGLVQMTIGNFIEPKIMGDRLRLNTVTVIFGLVFWGIIWGIPGMLLSVPLLVILKLILEYSDTLSVVARIMGSHPKKK
ncbi:MAG: AI-2E family transporter [Spirochaetaceae bacterium]|jgi:AI-2 transport protein TqsA|nr:AI-2E family transporter [Spirochaetaceae bacterium]